MKVLVISENGKWLSIAQRINAEGNAVFFLTYHQNNIGEGMVKKFLPHFSLFKSTGELHTYNLKRLLRKFQPEMVILEGNYGCGLLYNFFSSLNIPTYGGGLIQDALMEKTNYAGKMWSKLKLDGGEVRGVWNGEKFVVEMEYLNEDNFIGKNSGVQIDVGGVGRIVKDNPILNKFKPMLKKMSFKGCIGINKDDYTFTLPLSFFEIYTGEITSFFSQITKSLSPQGKIINEFFAQNLISLPPFPFGENFNMEMCIEKRLPFNKPSLKHLWLEDVRMREGNLECAGTSGKLGYVSARGVNVKEVARRIYRTLTLHQIPNLQYRTDLGIRASVAFLPNLPSSVLPPVVAQSPEEESPSSCQP